MLLFKPIKEHVPAPFLTIALAAGGCAGEDFITQPLLTTAAGTSTLSGAGGG